MEMVSQRYNGIKAGAADGRPYKNVPTLTTIAIFGRITVNNAEKSAFLLATNDF